MKEGKYQLMPMRQGKIVQKTPTNNLFQRDEERMRMKNRKKTNKKKTTNSLNKILLAKISAVRVDQVEKLEYNRCNAVKESGPALGLQGNLSYGYRGKVNESIRTK